MQHPHYEFFFSYAPDREQEAVRLIRTLETRHLRVFHHAERSLSQIHLPLATELSRVLHRQTTLAVVLPSGQYRRTPLTQVEHALISQLAPALPRYELPQAAATHQAADQLERHLLGYLEYWAQSTPEETTLPLQSLGQRLMDLPERLKYASPILLRVLAQHLQTQQPALAAHFSRRASKLVG